MEKKATTKKIIRRRLIGEVVSDKMAKTVVVKVVHVKAHPKYKKRYKVSSKYKAHDEKNLFRNGEKIVIEACRPISKDKRWRVIKKVEIVK
jgi:small subunit ribosomal protein S17